MPLKKGKQNIGKNIHELIKNSGKVGLNRVNGKVRPVKQAIAIALSVAKRK